MAQLAALGILPTPGQLQDGAEADGDTEAFVDEEFVEQDDELGKGTTEGLTGKVEHDENIRTVSDLWRQLSGDDSDNS